MRRLTWLCRVREAKNFTPLKACHQSPIGSRLVVVENKAKEGDCPSSEDATALRFHNGEDLAHISPPFTRPASALFPPCNWQSQASGTSATSA